MPRPRPRASAQARSLCTTTPIRRLSSLSDSLSPRSHFLAVLNYVPRIRFALQWSSFPRPAPSSRFRRCTYLLITPNIDRDLRVEPAPYGTQVFARGG